MMAQPASTWVFRHQGSRDCTGAGHRLRYEMIKSGSRWCAGARSSRGCGVRHLFHQRQHKTRGRRSMRGVVSGRACGEGGVGGGGGGAREGEEGGGGGGGGGGEMVGGGGRGGGGEGERGREGGGDSGEGGGGGRGEEGGRRGGEGGGGGRGGGEERGGGSGGWGGRISRNADRSRRFRAGWWCARCRSVAG